MDSSILGTIEKLADTLEQFLKACKSEGDSTIDDVLKRLDELKKDA